MSSMASTIRISGLGKGKLSTLRAHAKAHGVSAERYARQLIEDGLSLEQRARSTTFDELFAPVRADFRKNNTSEAELAKLVDEARTRHHAHSSGKKR